MAEEQFLAMLRFEGRSELEELPGAPVRGRDGPCFSHECADGIVMEQHISIKAAAEFSGYGIQYLRRALRSGQLEGIKIGQVWLIKLASLETYLRNGQMVRYRRHGPRKSIAEAEREATR